MEIQGFKVGGTGPKDRNSFTDSKAALTAFYAQREGWVDQKLLDEVAAVLANHPNLSFIQVLIEKGHMTQEQKQYLQVFYQMPLEEQKHYLFKKSADNDGLREANLRTLPLGAARDPNNQKTTVAHLDRPTSTKESPSLPMTQLKSLSVFDQGKQIGEGGMGRIHKGHNPQLNLETVIKIRTNSTDPSENQQRRARFLREAKVMAQLREHPSIPNVFDISIATSPEEEDFIVMEFVNGKNLKEVLADLDKAQRATTIPKLLKMLIKISDAVAYAHSHNIIHRDIKPENIMGGANGEPKLLDWGVAKIEGDPEESNDALAVMTKEGALVGTVNYMAPEQLLDGKAEKKSDVFALGSILTEILTGKRPVDKEGLASMVKAFADRQINHPQDYNKKVPNELNSLAAKALAIKPEDRPSAEQFSKDLRNYLEGSMLDSHSYSIPERLYKKVSSSSLTAPFGSAAIASAIVSLALLPYSSRQNPPTLKKLSKEPVKQIKESKATIEPNNKKQSKAWKLMIKADSYSRKRDYNAMNYAIERSFNHYKSPELFTFAARLYEETGQVSKLKELIAKDPLGYNYKFQLFQNDVQGRENRILFQPNKILEEILELAKKRSEENEYTAYCKGHNLLYDVINEYEGEEYKRGIKKALEYFNTALNSNKLDAFFIPYLKRGWCYQDLGKQEKAIADFTEAIKRNGKLSIAFYLRAKMLSSNRASCQDALSDINQAIKLDHKGFNVYASRGTINIQLGNYSEAKEDFLQQQANDNNEKNNYSISDNLTNLSIVSRLLAETSKDNAAAINNYKEALSYAKKAMKHKYSEQGRLNLAITLYHLKKSSEKTISSLALAEAKQSITHFKKLIETAPKSTQARLAKAYILLEENKTQEAIKAFQDYLKQDPDLLFKNTVLAELKSLKS